jgi:hypothetical protein
VENHLNQVDLVVDQSVDYFPLLLYSMLLVNEVYHGPMMNVLMVVVSMNVQVKNQVAVVWVVLMGLMDVFDLLMVDFH